MTPYYVLKLLDNQGIHRSDTFILGDVEFRAPHSDFSEELTAIRESTRTNHLHLNVELNCRVGTIVQANSSEEASLLADEKFVKALDIISSAVPVSSIRLANCGYTKDLASGFVKPIADATFTPSLSFMVSKGKLRPIEFIQWVAVQDSELAVRYKRSLHWARNAKWERNLQLKILFGWFAVEALFKETPEDNVGSLIRWFLGYPNGPSAIHVSSSIIVKLKSNPLYDRWKNRIRDAVEDIRIFRNNSVHSGFRNIDFSMPEIKLYSQIMVLGCSRSQNAVLLALRSGIETVPEFKKYVGLLFEENQNLVNDVHGTILYLLQNPSYANLSNNVYG